MTAPLPRLDAGELAICPCGKPTRRADRGRQTLYCSRTCSNRAAKQRARARYAEHIRRAAERIRAERRRILDAGVSHRRIADGGIGGRRERQQLRSRR